MIDRVFTWSEGVQCIHATDAGLWLGHQGGVSFFSPETGSRCKWTTSNGLPAQPVLHIASCGSRLAAATPNGIAWVDDMQQLLQDVERAAPSVRWQRGLMHARGAGVYVNGLEFVDGRIHATTGGGRVYLEKESGFQLLELPVPQARLLRLLSLASPRGTLRLLLISNNSGILLLATGEGEEPSLYQWSEPESLCSRYVTSIALAGSYVTVGVHGCIHVARQRDLVENPDKVSRWGRVTLSDLQVPTEHSRIHALCEHGDFLYAGTSAGLYRVSLDDVAAATRDRVAAERIDEYPVRHLAAYRDELWAVQHSGVGKFIEGGRATVQRPLQNRSEREPGRGGGAADSRAPTPRITSFGRRWRFVPEARWRGFNAEPESHQVVCLTSTPEGIAFGGESGRVVLHWGKRWVTESLVRQRRSPEVHSLVYDPDGAQLWAATRHGLFHRDPRGRWMRDLAFPGRTVHQLVVWQGNVAALGSAGLHMYVQSAWSEIPFVEETPPLFSAVSGDPGLVLAGRPGAGFFIWRPDAPQPAPLALSVGRANCMTWDATGALWLGTDRGIARWSGDELTAFRWNAESEDHITTLLVHRGRLFVGSHAGVWIAAVDDLEPSAGEALEAKGRRLGLLDGLPNAHVSSLVVHADRVWVGTHGGLTLLGQDA
ncbi:MAG: hypothetical protein JSW67_04105 [Candidatus Latescibacterota bacterium]|nr:MAG: hypothetical protein JSW67_04105 [Candidatus Latescibacterota bacterium]